MILILGVLMAMTIPRIAIVRNQAREAAMKMNLHNVQTVIEEFHAENGYYAEDFYEDGYGGIFPGGVPDTTIGTLPLNPWTNVQMDPDEFNPYDYDNEADLSNNTQDGPNDQSDYSLGEIVYADFPAVGAEVIAGSPYGELESVKAGYGLVGIGRGGISIRSLNADEEAVIFLLHS